MPRSLDPEALAYEALAHYELDGERHEMAILAKLDSALASLRGSDLRKLRKELFAFASTLRPTHCRTVVPVVTPAQQQRKAA